MSLQCSYCEDRISGRYTRWEDGIVACAACIRRHPRCKRCGKLAVGGGLCSRCDAEVLRCGLCSEPILGRYVKHPEVAALCQGCHGSLPSCARCSGRYIEGQRHLERGFCQRCFSEGERCVLCTDIAVGRFWRFEQLGVVCGRCKTDSPTCSRCRVPAPEATQTRIDGREARLCPRCWTQAARCHACALPLKRYITHPRAPDRKFCPSCAQRADCCDFCGVLLHQEGFSYPDGRLSCPACQRTAVVRDDVLRRLEGDARRWMSERFSLVLRPASSCPVHLVGADRIAAVQDKAFRATPGFDRRERGLFSARIRERTRGSRVVSREETLAIYIETGLPRHEAYGTLVHELAHLWQLDAFPSSRRVSRQYVEGVACWLQFHALEDAGARAEAEQVATSPDPIYGGGYRMVAQIEKSVGRTATLREVLRRVGGRWPS